MSIENALLEQVSMDDIDKVLAERHLHEFIKQSWATIEPGRQFHDNWHIGAICEHLEAVVNGEIRRLIINIPPRHMKSLTCDVGFPTWAWLHKPHLQFLFASYASALSIRDSVKCRRLIQSPWYQKNWGKNFSLTGDQNQKQRFENSKNGHRISTSVGGALTGEGGDIIVIDDPHNVKEAESDQVRASVLDWWDSAVQSRLNDPVTGAFVLIMQRVHQSDLTGHILQNQLEDEPWTHLCVPAEYENAHPHKYYTSLASATVKEDPRTEEGALLWPDRFPQKALDNLKAGLGTYATAGQLQQRPAPKGGGILKASWWRKWEYQIPEFIYVLQSWDTAFSERDTASYSACTTWGVFQHAGRYHIMIMDSFRDRLPYPELRRVAKDLHDEWKPDAVLIEKKASGQSLIQDMQQMGLMVLPYSPDRDKTARAHAASPMLESGIVWYPPRNWAEDVITHCAIFPAGDGSDVVDTVTQALLRLRKMWYAVPTDDDEDLEEIPDRDDPFNDVNVIPFRRSAFYG
jgi:predicted phage terminase large subunit-like protein